MTASTAARSVAPAGEWRAEAACRSGVDPEIFFPAATSGPSYALQVAAAKAVCGRCPVRARCLDWAMQQLPHGIAGGLTEQERTRLRAGGREPSGHDALALVVESRRALAAAGRAAIAAGKSPQQVAREFGVTQRTAQRWAQQVFAAISNTGSAGGGEDSAATGLPAGSHPHTARAAALWLAAAALIPALSLVQTSQPMYLYRLIQSDGFPAVRMRSSDGQGRYVVPAKAIEQLLDGSATNGSCVESADLTAQSSNRATGGTA